MTPSSKSSTKPFLSTVNYMTKKTATPSVPTHTMNNNRRSILSPSPSPDPHRDGVVGWFQDDDEEEVKGSLVPSPCTGQQGPAGANKKKPSHQLMNQKKIPTHPCRRPRSDPAFDHHFVLDEEEDNQSCQSQDTGRSTLVSTGHDRQRRQERQVDKILLQRARRYGLAQHQANGRIKYTHDGLVFIYDPTENRAITCWKLLSSSQEEEKVGLLGESGQRSKGTVGLKNRPSTTPVILPKNTWALHAAVVEQHQQIHDRVRHRPECWASHAIWVLDMSGSMRRNDLHGARCRSDGVWLSLARDYIRPQLRERRRQYQLHQDLQDPSNSSSSSVGRLYDVVTVITFQEEATVQIDCEPLDEVLYNRLLDLREWDRLQPAGHGYYIPALRKAQEWLQKSATAGSCALSLLFFSDGRPSDVKLLYQKEQQEPGGRGPSPQQLLDSGAEEPSFSKIYRRYARPAQQEMGRVVSDMAQMYGRLLTMACVGMAEPDQDFSVLQDLADTARTHGVRAFFQRASLHTDSISSILTNTLLTNLTQTKTELSSRISTVHTQRANHPCPSPLALRTDVVREDLIITSTDARWNGRLATPDEWHIFAATPRDPSNPCYTARVWAWERNIQDFVPLLDPRCVVCYQTVARGDSFRVPCSSVGKECPVCHAVFFCWFCEQTQQVPRVHGAEQCRQYQEWRRKKLLRRQAIHSYQVAMRRKAFGEGAERVVFQFGYLNEERRFIGPAMVAKESRFVDEVLDEKSGTSTNSALSPWHQTSQRKLDYHRPFARAQALAGRFADLFNSFLDSDLPSQSEVESHDLIKQYPRIRFFEPLIFELVQPRNGKENIEATKYVLVEPFLEGTYRKFSNNAGQVIKAHSVKPNNSLCGNDNRIAEGVQQIVLFHDPREMAEMNRMVGLNAILEEDDVDSAEESEIKIPSMTEAGDTIYLHANMVNDRKPINDYEDLEVFDSSKITRWNESLTPIPTSDFLHAFSHFTFVKSGGRFMVVDLQGTLLRLEDGRLEFVLTDPAIHRRKSKSRSKLLEQGGFGRTDRGAKGIQEFLRTHVCNEACSLLGLRPGVLPTPS